MRDPNTGAKTGTQYNFSMNPRLYRRLDEETIGQRIGTMNSGTPNTDASKTPLTDAYIADIIGTHYTES
jgi:hypothetical protein